MQEACEMLYKKLSKEDIELIKQGKVDASDMHFGLGLWIRNNWIYKGLNPEDLGMEPFTCFPDMLSNDIIEAFIEYIRKGK